MFYSNLFYHFFDLFKKTILVFYKLFSLYVLTTFVAIFKGWVVIFIYNIKKIRIDFFFLFLFLSQNFIFSFIFTSYIYYCLRNSIVYNDSPPLEGLILFSATTLICISLNKHTQHSKGAAVIPNNSKKVDDNLIEVSNFPINNQLVVVKPRYFEYIGSTKQNYSRKENFSLLKNLCKKDNTEVCSDFICPLKKQDILCDSKGIPIPHEFFYNHATGYNLVSGLNNREYWLCSKPSEGIRKQFIFENRYLDETCLDLGFIKEVGFSLCSRVSPTTGLITKVYQGGTGTRFGDARYLLGKKSLILEFYSGKLDTSFFFSKDFIIMEQNSIGKTLTELVLNCGDTYNSYKFFFRNLYYALLNNKIGTRQDFEKFCELFIINGPDSY